MRGDERANPAHLEYMSSQAILVISYCNRLFDLVAITSATELPR